MRVSCFGVLYDSHSVPRVVHCRVVSVSALTINLSVPSLAYVAVHLLVTPSGRGRAHGVAKSIKFVILRDRARSTST